MAIIVGHEFPLAPPIVAGFEWINAVFKRERTTDRAYNSPSLSSRPFSADRSGFLLSESVGVVVLAQAAYAERFGWEPIAFLKGGYMNSDGDHLTRISHGNVATCMRRAIENSGFSKAQIKCISAHATSTPTGDAAELGALSEVFGEELPGIMMMANKSQVGHALGAACAIQVILAAEAIRNNVVLPTLNYEIDTALPRAGISVSARDFKHGAILVNSFGFGGTNVSLVVAPPHL